MCEPGCTDPHPHGPPIERFSSVNWLHAIILGIVEGITEVLPVSSTGHLRIVEKLLGYDIQGAGITAFTAIIQVGA
ncbi:undecaprenyl-diphosphate phosphatase, partial [Streptococcus pneumoniae]|nr:undecaprenyl-diphosphate phosphatase [Streptococcus pneumoniae]